MGERCKTRLLARGETKTQKTGPLKGFKLSKGVTLETALTEFAHALCLSNKRFTFLFTFYLLIRIPSYLSRQGLGI